MPKRPLRVLQIASTSLMGGAELLTRWVAHGLPPAAYLFHLIARPLRKWHHVWLDRLTANGVSAWVAVCEAGHRTRMERERFPGERSQDAPFVINQVFRDFEHQTSHDLFNQHRVAVAVKAVALGNGQAVSLKNALAPGQGGHQEHQG